MPRGRHHLQAQLQGRGVSETSLDDTVLLFAEIATNAVLHAGSDLRIGVGVHNGVLQVAVEDQSPLEPTVRHHGRGASTGRGVALVERLADTWGVRRLTVGKQVWFELSTQRRECFDPSAADLGWAEFLAGIEPGTASGLQLSRLQEHCIVTHLGVPVRLAQTTLEYAESLDRELALVQYGRGEEGQLVAKLEMAPFFQELHLGRQEKRALTTFTVPYCQDAVSAAERYLKNLRLASSLAEENFFLTPPALPEIQACWEWILGNIIRQSQGETPTPWVLPSPATLAAHPRANLDPTQKDQWDTVPHGVFVIDPDSYLIHVNAAGAEILGWEVSDLVGRRLLEIVPPHLREAHIAGFAHHRLTGETTISGHTVQVPALRKDGTTVDVSLLVERLATSTGYYFQGTLWPEGTPAPSSPP